MMDESRCRHSVKLQPVQVLLLACRVMSLETSVNIYFETFTQVKLKSTRGFGTFIQNLITAHLYHWLKGPDKGSMFFVSFCPGVEVRQTSNG